LRDIGFFAYLFIKNHNTHIATAHRFGMFVHNLGKGLKCGELNTISKNMGFRAIKT